MSGKIIDFPANPVTGAPETLPWATQGTVLPPNSSQQETGWQPYGVGPPPDYRLENYARLTQSTLNARANQAGLFLTYTYARVTLAGATVGNNRRIVVDGTNIDYADQAGDTLADVVAAFVTLINTDPAASLVAVAEATGAPGVLDIVGVEPGNDFSVTVSVLAGAGTITLTTATTPNITRQPGDLAYAADLVIGASKLDAPGVAGQHARIIWDKSKAAFAAGKATGAQWDDASRGNGSINLGTDNTASGANSVALGYESIAQSTLSIAIGRANATNSSDIAIGGNLLGTTDATGGSSIAIGSGAQASDVSTIAIGTIATANTDNAIAIGSQAQALNESAISIGTEAYSSQKGAIAIGCASDADLQSTARGAVAMGAPTSVATIAQGAHSFAHGEACDADAPYARAVGYAATATNYGEHVQSTYSSALGTKYGEHQAGRLVLSASTNGATSVDLTLDKEDGTGAVWTLRQNRSYAIRILCIASTGSKYALWNSTGIINCSGAGTSSVIVATTSAPQQHSGAGANTLTLVCTAGAGGVISWTGTGNAGDLYYWTLEIDFSETRIS